MSALMPEEVFDFLCRLFLGPSQEAGHGLRRMIDNVAVDMTPPGVTRARAENAA
jgi:hypothetical protein